MDNNQYRIYIVEDDKIIADKVASHLQEWGYETRCVKDFNKVMTEFAAFDPQLVLMDISLPFFNGYYWCQEIRKVSKVPIMFLSSASDQMNIMTALQLGADDFVTKPFDLSILTNKIYALLRRAYDFSCQSHILEYRGAILNLGNATLTYQGEITELTKNEFRILQILMENRGKTVCRDALMTALWESDSFVDDNTLTVNITRLRKKLTQTGLEQLIQTKKGMGYIVE